ncbi:MAG TPA: alanine--tRNA ligase-related protein, partial [Candidatus Angelobacter sp.]|nr:alanine--tRNA ligase-related protein [Candidatus Angelobacter sp.]
MPSTERLYYHDSFLFDFDARVIEALGHSGRTAIVLDRTAFYPTSGGQVHDLGVLLAEGKQIAITEVADEEDGRILHFSS